MLDEILNNCINQNEILPHYDKYSILNLSNWILYNFNLKTFYEPYPLNSNKKNHIILFLVDAMSYNTLVDILKNYKNELKILNNFSLKSGTSIFPSTTSNALTTLLTAKSPLEHGICGFHLYIKEFASLMNMIALSPAKYNNFNISNSIIDNLLKEETIPELLNNLNINCFNFTHSNIVNSGLSKLHNKKGNLKGYRTKVELMLNLKDHLHEHINEKTFNFVYYGLADGIGHKYGVNNKYYEYEIYYFLKSLEDLFLKDLSDKINKKTHIIITSDHGMLETPKEKENYVSFNDKIDNLLTMPPGGEMRMWYLYNQKNSERLKQILLENFSNTFSFYSIKEAIDLKILLEGNMKERSGTHILIANNRNSFIYKLTGSEPYLKGKHGALSKYEMIIPILHNN